MKREFLCMRSFVCKLFSVLGCFSGIQALPTGNPMTARLWSIDLYSEEPSSYTVAIGFYGDYVTDRKMEITSRLAFLDSEIAQTSLYTNAGVCVCSIGDLALHGVLGVTTLYLETPGGVFFNHLYGHDYTTIKNTTTSMYYPGKPSVGGGFHWMAYKLCGIGFGLFGQCFYTQPVLDYLNVRTEEGSLSYIHPVHTSRAFQYSEWQGGIGFSTDIAYNPCMYCAPYITVKACHAKFQMRNTSFELPFSSAELVLRDMRERHILGYTVGATFVIQDVVYATVEGRWYDEYGVHASMQVVF